MSQNIYDDPRFPANPPEVDEEKCMACGACVKVCPQKIIHIHECANYIVVKCSNKKKGAEARKQ